MNYKNKIWSKIWRNLIIWMAIIFAVFPIVFIIGTSFNPANSINTTQIFPRNPTLENYKSLIIGENNIFLVWVWNTLKISFLTAGISVFFMFVSRICVLKIQIQG